MATPDKPRNIYSWQKNKTNSVFYEEVRHYLALSLLKGNKVEEAKTVLENSESSSNIVLLKEINDL